MNNDGQAFELTPPRPPGTLWVDSLKERWFATARGRVGYAVDKYLFFVSAGAAWAKLDSAEFLLAPVGPFTTTALQSDRRSGWTAGVGMEYALSYGWSMRTEYLYIQFPSYTTFSNGVFFPTNIMNQSVGRLSNYVWRTGFSYKFGYAPAVAK